MWMSNYTDEATFDEFGQDADVEGHVEKIRKSYLGVAGEADSGYGIDPVLFMLAALDVAGGFMGSTPGPSQFCPLPNSAGYAIFGWQREIRHHG
jgi:hypothetical protein